MTHAAKRHLRIALAVAVSVACLFGNEDFSFTALLTGTQSLMTQAQAIIGRPLTPMSYAAWRGGRFGGASIDGASIDIDPRRWMSPSGRPRDSCPGNMWAKVDSKATKDQYHLLGVFKNGPRFWMYDWIELPVGAQRDFDGDIILDKPSYKA